MERKGPGNSLFRGNRFGSSGKCVPGVKDYTSYVSHSYVSYLGRSASCCFFINFESRLNPSRALQFFVREHGSWFAKGRYVRLYWVLFIFVVFVFFVVINHWLGRLQNPVLELRPEALLSPRSPRRTRRLKGSQRARTYRISG